MRLKMTKNIKKILEKNGFDVTKSDGRFFIHQYTPTGEDWGFYIDNLSDIDDYAYNFDPEDEFEMWVEAKHNGARGVPSVSELWQDQLWKQELLNKVADKITK